MRRGRILFKGWVADDECEYERGWMAGLLMMVNFDYLERPSKMIMEDVRGSSCVILGP